MDTAFEGALALSPARRIHLVPSGWLTALVILSAIPELRLADVQALEMLQLLRALLILLLFAQIGARIPTKGVWREYGRGFAAFLALTSLFAVAAIRLRFYAPSSISLLKFPIVLSISRILEIALAVYFLLAIADTLRTRPKLLKGALTAYGAIGIVSAIASLLALAIFMSTGSNALFVSPLDHRARGFFNEGGPYGLFLVSVLIVLSLKRRLFPPASPIGTRAALALIWVVLFLSASKAGLLAAIVCGLATLATSAGRRRRTLAVLILPIACLGFLALFQFALRGYVRSYVGFDETVLFRPTDRNLIMGRIVAAFIIPRMISAHPILGIGIGNYSLMRNDPDYLKGLPFVDDWDLPGLGLISDAAELGVPLTLFLAVLLLYPLRQARKQNAPPGGVHLFFSPPKPSPPPSPPSPPSSSPPPPPVGKIFIAHRSGKVDTPFDSLLMQAHCQFLCFRRGKDQAQPGIVNRGESGKQPVEVLMGARVAHV